VNDLVAPNNDVRIKSNDLPLEFSFKAGHHRDNDNEYADPEDDAQNGNQRDDREKSALRLQVAQREKAGEWQPDLIRHEAENLAGIGRLPSEHATRALAMFVFQVGTEQAPRESASGRGNDARSGLGDAVPSQPPKSFVRLRLKMRKQDHVSNRFGSRQYHHEAVYTDPYATGGRHPMFQGQQKILVEVLDLVASLVQQALPLNCWIIQFRVARRDLLAIHNQLVDVYHMRVFGVLLGQRHQLDG
jgi:hypothetical protein